MTGYVSGGEYPHIMVYFMPGGQWHYVVPEESAKVALARAVDTISPGSAAEMFPDLEF